MKFDALILEIWRAEEELQERGKRATAPAVAAEIERRNPGAVNLVPAIRAWRTFARRAEAVALPRDYLPHVRDLESLPDNAPTH